MNGMAEPERRGLYLGPGNWIQWMTLAEVEERVRHTDNPKEYALSLWNVAKIQPSSLVLKGWPDIPEVPIKFNLKTGPEDGSRIAAPVEMDLGVLGIWTSEQLKISPEAVEEFGEEGPEEMRRDAQYAFENVILKAAAKILAKRGEGLGPMHVFLEGLGARLR